MSNLQRENREQINVIKKATHDHKMEVESLKKKNQVSGYGRCKGEGVGSQGVGRLGGK